MNQFQNMYQPYQSNRMFQPQSYQMPTNNGINWVQGIEGAKAWQLAPNSNVLLMDSENDGKFYIKVSDNVGMCTLRVFNYVETTNEPAKSAETVDFSQFITRNELNELLDKRLNSGGKTNGKQLISTVDTKPVISE